MATDGNGGQPEVKSKMPGWGWGIGVILVALLAYAGTQMMSAQQKSEEVNRLLEAARTAQTQAEALAEDAKKKLEEGTTKLRTELDELRAALDDTTSKLQQAETDVETYRKRVEDLEAERSGEPAANSPPAQ